MVSNCLSAIRGLHHKLETTPIWFFYFFQDLSPTRSLAWCVQAPAKSTQTFTTAWMLWKRCRFQSSLTHRAPNGLKPFSPLVFRYSMSAFSILGCQNIFLSISFQGSMLMKSLLNATSSATYCAKTTSSLTFCWWVKCWWVTPHIRLTNPTLTLTLLQ